MTEHGMAGWRGLSTGSVMDSELGDFTALSNVLWREREALTTVVFKLGVEQLIVSAGQTRWLAEANRELESALDALRTTEVLRSIESGALAERLGLPGDATLAQLATAADEPWATILTEHRDALIELVDEVRSTADQNRRLLDAASALVKQTLSSIVTSVGTYDAQGATASGLGRPNRLDEQA